jgi:hypothetical protein
MDNLKHFYKYFDSTIRSRGLNYYQENRVKNSFVTPELLRYEVRGSRNYSVELELKPSKIKISCDCPYFYDRGSCKHIWAALLKAYDDQLLYPITSEKPQVVSSGINEDPDDDFKNTVDNDFSDCDRDCINCIHRYQCSNSSLMGDQIAPIKNPSREIQNKSWKQLFFSPYQSTICFNNQKQIHLGYVLSKPNDSIYQRPVLSLIKNNSIKIVHGLFLRGYPNKK